MTKIALQVQICQRLADSPLDVKRFFALCLIADMRANGEVVTYARLAKKVKFDAFYLLKKLVTEGMLRQIPITHDIEGLNGNSTAHYVLTDLAIKTLTTILE